MSAYRAALLALFVVGGTLVTAVPSGAAPPHATVGEVTATDEAVGVGSRATAVQNATANNSSLGADISSFMQSSVAEVDGVVETGMWTAAYNATDNRSVKVALVERQTEDLREQLAELRQRKAELVAERNASNVSDAAYKAKLGHLVGRVHALRTAINATASRAREVNANVAAVAELQTGADNLTGPEIAAVARNVTGVSVGNGPRGGPRDVGNANANNANGNGNGAGNGNANGNGIAGAGNRTTGRPNDAGHASSNDGRRGPPDHADAPMVGNQSGNETAIPRPGTPTPPVTVNGSTDGTTVLPAELSADDAAAAVSATTSDVVVPVADALAVRTYALSRVLAAA